MRLSIRQATLQDIDVVSDILREAAAWFEQRGMPLWRQDELQLNGISAEVHSGLFFLAESDGEPAGTIKYQLEDKLFWPDVPQDDSAFISPSGGEKTLCRRGGFLGSAPLGHRTYAHARPALSPLGLRSLTTAVASAL